MNKIANRPEVKSLPMSVSKSNKLDNYNNNIKDLVLTSDLQESENWFSGEKMKKEFKALKAMQMKNDDDKCGCECEETELHVQTSYSDGKGKSVKGEVQVCNIDDDPSTEDKIVVEGKLDASYNRIQGYKHYKYQTTVNGNVKITYLEKDGYLQKVVKEDATKGVLETNLLNNDIKLISGEEVHQNFAFVVDEKNNIVQQHDYL
ncbi:MAG: hypothetical protein ABRQ38_15570 [Candidatus Eremiobacterota bacterium]